MNKDVWNAVNGTAEISASRNAAARTAVIRTAEEMRAET